MKLTQQRGELSLFWAAVIVGVVTLAAVGTLLSMRHERNLFGDAWRQVKRTNAGQTVQDVVAQTGRPEATSIRKCLIDGKVVYSNVECGAGNPTSRRLALQDTKGIEAPKAPPASQPVNSSETVQEKMIEQAVQR